MDLLAALIVFDAFKNTKITKQSQSFKRIDLQNLLFLPWLILTIIVALAATTVH